MAAAHDDGDSGGLRDPSKRGRIAANLLEGEINQRSPAGLVKQREFLARQVLVVEQPGPPVLADQVGEDVLVRQDNAQIGGVDWAGN
jgi:hypothetical protein